MTFKLSDIVPWGRSATEYQGMFNLNAQDLTGRILDCGGGPASFNARMTTQGCSIVSCDPLYQFSVAEIEQRIQAVRPVILAGVEQTCDRFVWSQIRSLVELDTIRMNAMQQFLQDLLCGKADGRYVVAELPRLPFGDRTFDLAISSHLLFTYSDQFSAEFHVAALRELLRVAPEVRIFPIVENFTGEPSPHLPIVLEQLQTEVKQLEVVTVGYEFQRNGNEMLRIVA
ncbi:MAG: class I SAM-dependent methyltransferase [Spirulina sp. SIO3F2]|nr:class I SAM-dependent methyltransferase [Spirulina sp. SIO3F2]